MRFAALPIRQSGLPSSRTACTPPLLFKPPRQVMRGSDFRMALPPRYGVRWQAQRDTALSLLNNLIYLAITVYALRLTSFPPIPSTRSTESTDGMHVAASRPIVSP